jgi:hypothetical protein
VTEIRLSPLQVRALELLAKRDPACVVTGQEVHGAVASALVGKGLAKRVPLGTGPLYITDEGRKVAARLAGDGS